MCIKGKTDVQQRHDGAVSLTDTVPRCRPVIPSSVKTIEQAYKLLAGPCVIAPAFLAVGAAQRELLSGGVLCQNPC